MGSVTGINSLEGGHLASSWPMIMGLVGGVYYDTKYGFNGDVDGAEDIIIAGGDYAGFPTSSGTSLGTEENFELVCASAADTAAGTGAQAVDITYLDDDGLMQTVTIETNGGSQDIGISGIRSVRGRVSRSGSGGVNAGLITLRHVTTIANVFWTIPAGDMQTNVAAVTVPSNRRAIITNGMFIPDRSGSIIVKGHFAVRYQGNEGFTPKFLIQGSDVSNPTPNQGVINLPPLADVKLRAGSVSSVNAEVGGQFDYCFYEKPQ